MIIKPRKRTASAPVAQKQPEPQRIVEKKPVVKEVKKNSTNKVKSSFAITFIAFGLIKSLQSFYFYNFTIIIITINHIISK